MVTTKAISFNNPNAKPMPMVVKIVGSTPTTSAINESEVVGVLDTEQNKQIYEARVVRITTVSDTHLTLPPTPYV